MPEIANPIRSGSVVGKFIQINGQDFYQIENYDKMPPFLISLVSVGDQWMYVSSTGGLTAGRVSAENCLFPYLTVDLLHDCHSHTGPLTLVRHQETGGQYSFWQPFEESLTTGCRGSRKLLKHVAGDQLIFQETNERLGLAFSSSWRTSTKFGFIRTATLENTGSEEIEIELIDGLQNLTPSGVPLTTYQRASCLVDAYKHNEYDAASGLGIYSLTSQILDRAEAAEVLRATTVWCRGLSNDHVFLSSKGLNSFCAGETPEPESLCTGQRGNFFTYTTLKLAPGQSHSWYLVADVGRDHQQVAEIRRRLGDEALLDESLEQAIHDDHKELLRNVASADGLQSTGSQLATAHHFANVLFNNMRGGVFRSNYTIESHDFIAFVASRNLRTKDVMQTFLRSLPERIDSKELLKLAREQRNTDLVRIVLEYLPLTFGRRHGDPSRPWNVFEIHVRNEDGSCIYNYQGNWRDIFQNWEALANSFPAFLPNMIAKFVNASTIDGFNPYRISRDGIDWEAPDPEDPWSNIGYWGDHQIIYLTRLLESLQHSFPGQIEGLLEDQIFCYANVPYRIRPYEDIVENSSETIDYDRFTAQEIARRVEDLGADGKLVLDAQGDIYYVNLIEKLLVPVLTKLSNFALDGGIWLNTQRPEWNDANNALVGSGLSMVTVGYLRRHLNLLIGLIREIGDRRLSISIEVEQWFRSIRSLLQENRHLLHETTITEKAVFRILQVAGQAFSDYRLKVYDEGFSGKHTIGSTELVEFFRLAVEYLDHSIRANRRADCLYHAYNLLDLNSTDHSASVNPLYEMLEGQVSALSSGLLDAAQAVELIDAMFESKLFRQDQSSFMLYPDRSLDGFLLRNRIPEERLSSVSLLREMVKSHNRSIIVQDVFGEYHFAAAIQRQAELNEQLDKLGHDSHWSELVARDRREVIEVFEEVFSHKTYTGRSGTMYGYEGLGCIYWHMVSKLLLAVQENVFSAIDRQASKNVIDALADAYYLVRAGLSSDKTPSQYGAFPTDPYSHSPKHSGAQQPGMTGQVKEEILTRQGELGIRILEGRLHFDPVLLRRREFEENSHEFHYFNLTGEAQLLQLGPIALAFTVCQVPIVYYLSDEDFSMDVHFANGSKVSFEQAYLDAHLSLKLFERTGEITRIEVRIPEQAVLRA
ncbi:hypothetical protein [Bythopirellula goksoeyrii]|uniref:Glycosyl hydrolase 36 catalytic domain-containing protein n=1 Tax=Bythopirellula goksoeyrii TaxID=1400387 RepID=A0A5B9QBP2_9BACT|nr:hypothetical protein [Bythopirellula goksoeyrii]QEG36424.1 hypothetical protein Pr1d_37380 [Bythopirellula goksoeyrii]